MADPNAPKEKDPLTGIETTGHEWDGIKELNTPMPKWWLYTLYICCVWGVIYTIAMPAWPYISGEGWTHTKGFLGYTQRETVRTEVALENAQHAELYKKLDGMNLRDIVQQPPLVEQARAAGQAAFAENCSGCHGSAAQGFKGFPNLQDDDWIWGGSLNQIHTTILHGVRWGSDDETRQSAMPAWVKDGMITPAQANDVVDYVLSLSKAKHDAAAAARGAGTFTDNCTSCHGADAKGNIELGAPNLTDAIWLYGGSRADIYNTVANSHAGAMPAWGQRLDKGLVKALAIYVHSLGGGRPDEETAATETPAEPTPAAAPVAETATP
jgi:cytochrome c oxidase cbb3-type subunit III